MAMGLELAFSPFWLVCLHWWYRPILNLHPGPHLTPQQHPCSPFPSPSPYSLLMSLSPFAFSQLVIKLILPTVRLPHSQSHWNTSHSSNTHTDTSFSHNWNMLPPPSSLKQEHFPLMHLSQGGSWYPPVLTSFHPLGLPNTGSISCSLSSSSGEGSPNSSLSIQNLATGVAGWGGGGFFDD